MTHVVQQGGVQRSLQKKGKPDAIIKEHGDLKQVPPEVSASCSIAEASPIDEQRIDYNTNSFVLNDSTKPILDDFAKRWKADGKNKNVRIDGYASANGTEPLNWRLSCSRANTVKKELMHPSNGGAGVTEGAITTYAHGETNRFSHNQFLPNQTATITSEIKIDHHPFSPDRGNEAYDKKELKAYCSKGDYSNGKDEKADKDHDLEQGRYPEKENFFLINYYDYFGGEKGALKDFTQGFGFGTLFEPSTQDGNRLKDHFLYDNGNRINFDPYTDMSRIIGKEKGFKLFDTLFRSEVTKYIDRTGSLCGFDGNAFLLLNNPGYFKDQLFAHAVMGGYNRIEIHMELAQAKTIRFIKYKIYDHFGAGLGDAGSLLPGLAALYYLQHFAGKKGVKYTPFIWSVEIRRDGP
ncbi:MAG: hypothetical protein JWP37_351 [Mucilaginibacter sp.]|nr:hypothetical protein [Mucilaginibacter sp.]